MKALRAVLWVLFLSALALLVIAFSVSNAQSVAVDFLLGFKLELPLAVWLIVSLLSGLFLGWFLSVFRVWSLKRQNKRQLRDMVVREGKS